MPEGPCPLKTELKYRHINITWGHSVTQNSQGIISRGIFDFRLSNERLNHSFCPFEVEDTSLWPPK